MALDAKRGQSTNLLARFTDFLSYNQPPGCVNLY